MDKEYLDSALGGYGTNPSKGPMDFKTAQWLSGNEITAFEKFSNGYLDIAMEHITQSATNSNFDKSIKSKFCIQLLTLNTLNEKVKTFCKGVAYQYGGLPPVEFDKLKDLSQPVRTCAYPNFLKMESAASVSK